MTVKKLTPTSPLVIFLIFICMTSASNAWQVPVGLTVGKTFILESGYMIDVNLGGYYLAVSPKGGADSQLKFGVSLFFP